MKKVLLGLVGLSCFAMGTVALAASTSGVGVGLVAQNVTSNLGNVAKLITAASYVAGLAFVVGAIVKFKTHKENPTQIPIGTPIALLFVGAALIFIPSVFKTSGATLFGSSGNVGNVSGLTSFGGVGSSTKG
jgi:intracellular multiplication protein IcmD